MDTLRLKLINQIIDENYLHASVLFFFGISFYNYSEQTLEQVCNEKGLDVDVVVKKLESITSSPSEGNVALEKYPIDLIIEYLKHTHYIFIKHKLPYITQLISTLENSNHEKCITDLKFIFPVFAEDFIKHIYEEEDTLFTYILKLNNSLAKKQNFSSVYFAMEKHSIRDYAVQHSNDDEMKGIRDLTNNYTLTDPKNVHLKVIYGELKSFEEALKQHAQIEDEILFVKALNLENEVSNMIRNRIAHN